MENKMQPTVLVTGFGPFKNHNVNASWQAVKLLPELFKTWEKSSEINLILEEIPVAYENVSSKIKELWKQHKPLIIIHIGVSSVAKCLTIECQAHSNGYIKLDILQKLPNEENIENTVLKTELDVHEICRSVNVNSHKLAGCEACVSDEAGRFLCEYIYYQSLSLEKPKVLFVHVPDFDIYPSEKTAQGLLQVLIHVIEHTCFEKCDEK